MEGEEGVSVISTVVPATPRSEGNGECELRWMELIMKLHYIRAVYFFTSEAAQGLSISDLKKNMFPLLDRVPRLVSGRIRISESGQPVIKCNDAGVRVAESHRHCTLREWFQQHGCSLEGLVPDHVLGGPDLAFSPLVFLKFTWFECGGLCVGLSWSHILGDAFSAFNFMAEWSQIRAPTRIAHTLSPKPKLKLQSPPHNGNPISVKIATTTGELWLPTTRAKIVTHTFHVTPKQLNLLTTSRTTATSSYFKTLSAFVWSHVAHIRGESEPRAVTVVTHGGEGLVLSSVEASFAVAESDMAELARVIGEEKREEEVVEEGGGGGGERGDFVVYGANLTFVDLESGDDLYGVVLNGHKPVVANCCIHGVGDEGVVLVLPAPEGVGGGRMVTVSLAEEEVEQLKDKLRREWGIESLPFS
ncbi:hypothetical protein Fmac_031493 [Flemingia macrophylla]|uniref:Uncharacterized protein n=1 Tax=Flemingia macrophylla TaxID=520843 RepID=A0ABD1L291_9FABA